MSFGVCSTENAVIDATRMQIEGAFRILLLALAICSPLLMAGVEASTLGPQRTMLFMIAWAPNTPDPVWVEQGRQAIFGTDVYSLDTFYRWSSYGQTWFYGDTLAISIPWSSGCDRGTWIQLADAEAGRRGYDITLYPRRIYAYTSWDCPFRAAGSSGPLFTNPDGTHFSMTFFAGNLGPRQHEMGHSFGLSHANSSNGVEYGDPTDIMGSGFHGFSAAYRAALGWLGWTEITQPGTYQVTNLDATTGQRVLRIYRPANRDYYYVGYRQGSEPWATFNPQLFTGVNIHSWTGIPWSPQRYDTDHSFLYDATPGSTYGYLDAQLRDGAWFCDSTNGIQVKQMSHDGGSATVYISFGPCSPPVPKPQCSDGLDNDGDGLIDYPADPGCTNADDSDETEKPCVPRGQSGKCRK